jgi:RNA polymerase sigma-70 factor, ECF subfamily
MPAPQTRDPRRERFEALFEAELGYVWTSLRRLGVDARDIEDVAHEVFLSVYKRFDELDPGRPTRPWLFAFALRHAADYRRLARHRADLLGDEEPPVGAASSAEDDLARRQRAALVERALEAVDLEKRAVLILHDLDEVPMPEAAATLGIPVNTGYSRLRAAREELAGAVRRVAKTMGGSP